MKNNRMNIEKMKEEFSLLETMIKEKCKGGPVYYLPNPGNLGDSLIREGTLKFFKDIGLKYTYLEKTPTKKLYFKALIIFDKAINFLKTIGMKHTYLKPLSKLSTIYPKGTLIFGGGGAWCNLWNREDLIKNLSKYYKHIIVLPSTYEVTTTIPNVTFFRRDQYESKKNMPNTLFCHDMAFYLSNINVKSGDGKGYFFRTDKESSNKITIPDSNNDISSKGDHLTPINIFIDAISKFNVIYTDRLHVAIGASLLGKEVHLYPGAYFKNKAVYLSSLKDYYKNIHFHDDKECSNLIG